MVHGGHHATIFRGVMRVSRYRRNKRVPALLAVLSSMRRTGMASKDFLLVFGGTSLCGAIE